MTFRPLRAAVLAAAVLSAVSLATLALAGAAAAAQLEADFHLNDTRTAPTGDTLADVGDGNAFAAESVDGGAERQVLTFPAGGGLSLPTTGLAGSGSYSVAILFRLDASTTGRRKLMDLSGGTSDAGLYLCDGALVIELLAATPCPLGSGAGGGWAQVVLTRDDATDGVAAYLDGAGSTANDALGALALGSELRLFLDDAVLPADEHSAGAVARLRVYDGVLSAAEVAALDRVDQTPPQVTLDSIPTPSTDATPSFSGTAETEAGDLSGVAVEVYAGTEATGTPVRTLTTTSTGGSWTAQLSDALTDGTYTARAEQQDGAGNIGASGTRTFTIDTAAPAPTLQSRLPGPGTTRRRPIPAAPATPPATRTVTVKVYSGSAATGDPVQTLTPTRTGTNWSVIGSTPLDDGTYTATAEQADAATNTGTSAPRTFTVDTASPSVSLTEPSAALINDRTPTYSGAAGEAAGDSTTVTVEIFAGSSATGEPVQTVAATQSGGGWSQEGSPELPDGTYTARAEQADEAGNTGLSTTRTFAVDGAGPDVSLDTPGAGPTNDNTPMYSGAGGDAPGDSETVTVRVYSGSVASGTPVQTLDTPRAGGTWSTVGSQLSDGTYTAQAAQSDSANNVNVSQPRTFTVDTLRPDTTITSAPVDPTNDSTPAFAFSSADAEGFVCRLYPAGITSAPAFGGCTSPRDAGPLGDGPYVFQVAAVDAAGNQDDSPGSRTFRVDTTAPQVSFSLAPGDTVATDATFAFAAGEPASFTCRLDGGAWEPCGSPRSYSGLPLGPHALEVSASDQAGNQGGPARHAWQVLKPGETIPGASRQAVALAQDIVQVRRALRRVPLPRAARRGAIGLSGMDALTPGTMRLVARARNRRFAVARRTVPAAGTYRLRLELTRYGRRLARRVPKMRVDLRLSFADSLARALQTSTTTTMFRRPPAR